MKQFLIYHMLCIIAGSVIPLNTLSQISQQKDIEERISSANDFIKYRGSATTLIVADTTRGGTFTSYTGKDGVDNGMVFIDGNGKKWLRETDGTKKINVRWYGAHGYAVGQPDAFNDNYVAFTAARDYIYNHKNLFSTLYIPVAYEGANNYYFLKTLVFDKDIRILGDGVFNAPKTLLYWPQNVTCIKLSSANGAHISIEDLAIRQGTENKKLDSNAHGIDANTFVHLKNIDVSYVSGNGINIRACADKNSPIFGNADQSVLENCQTYDCMNGLWIEGCDANVIAVTNCSFVHSKRWGVYDGGLLGNLFINCHFSNNGKASKDSNVVAIYDGRYYASVDGLLNLNKRPDTYPAFWYKIEPQGDAYAWNPKTRYWSGGAAIVANVNAFSKFDHAYTESFQPPVVLNNRSSYEGGDPGAGVRGVFLRVLDGNYIITGGSTQVDKLGVNQSPGDYLVGITSPDYKNLDLQSATNSVILRMGNSVDHTAGITYIDTTMIFSVTNGKQTYAFNKQSFYPSGVTGVSDLGNNYSRWKGIWGAGLDVTGSVTMNHLVGRGTAPSSIVGTGGGIKPAISITGTDVGGCISLQTGATPMAKASITTVIFNEIFVSAPQSIILTPANSNAAELSGSSMVYIEQAEVTNAAFNLKAGATGLTGGKLYKWYYQVIQ